MAEEKRTDKQLPPSGLPGPDGAHGRNPHQTSDFTMHGEDAPENHRTGRLTEPHEALTSGSWEALRITRDSQLEEKIWTSSHIISEDGQAATANDGSFVELAEATMLEDPLIGAVIEDRYEIIDSIGKGGMAVVYSAKQLDTGGIVAVKALKVNKVEDIMRFAREVKSHSRLAHENIVQYIEFIATSDGQFFLVMERIKGISVLEVIREIERIDSADNLGTILLQACDALIYAHLQGIIHRDLKTSNIILVKEEGLDHIIVKILDFGIAKTEGEGRITFSGRAVGSPVYMSPEQCMGQTLTAKSDIYSLGVVAYEMCTGKPPFFKGTVRDIMASHCTETVMPTPIHELVPHIPKVRLLDEIISKSLQTDPAKRWRRVTHMRDAVEYWLRMVHSGTDIDKLPEYLLTPDMDTEHTETRADFSLSSSEKDELYSIGTASSMQAGFGQTTASNPIVDLDRKEQKRALRIDPKDAALREAKRRVTTLSILLLLLIGSIILYIGINVTRSQTASRAAKATVETGQPVDKVSPEGEKEKAPRKKRARRKGR